MAEDALFDVVYITFGPTDDCSYLKTENLVRLETERFVFFQTDDFIRFENDEFSFFLGDRPRDRDPIEPQAEAGSGDSSLEDLGPSFIAEDFGLL